jgi:hypothetical protein
MSAPVLPPDMAGPLFAHMARLVENQMRAIEEQVLDSDARWELLRRALVEIAARADAQGEQP